MLSENIKLVYSLIEYLWLNYFYIWSSIILENYCYLFSF